MTEDTNKKPGSVGNGCLALVIILGIASAWAAKILLFDAGEILAGLISVALAIGCLIGVRVEFSERKKRKEDNDSNEQEKAKSAIDSNYMMDLHETSKHAQFLKAYGDLRLAYEYHDVKVCIIKGEEPDYTQLKIGDMLWLSKEPRNPHDNKAVKVTKTGEKIGYLYRGKLQDMANDHIDDCRVDSQIEEIDSEKGEIKIGLGFYQTIETYLRRMAGGKKKKTYKLTGNTSDEDQINVSFANIGDQVGCYKDFETGKYIAHLFDENVDVGYFPASANEALSEDHNAYVAERTENENGKYSIRIMVVFDE